MLRRVDTLGERAKQMREAEHQILQWCAARAVGAVGLKHLEALEDPEGLVVDVEIPAAWPHSIPAKTLDASTPP